MKHRFEGKEIFGLPRIPSRLPCRFHARIAAMVFVRLSGLIDSALRPILRGGLAVGS
jgi:hypothetical protein